VWGDEGLTLGTLGGITLYGTFPTLGFADRTVCSLRPPGFHQSLSASLKWRGREAASRHNTSSLQCSKLRVDDVENFETQLLVSTLIQKSLKLRR